MDINRLTEKTQEALHAAQSEALRRGNQQVDVEHLLAALLSQEGGLAASILKRAGANVEALAAKLDQDLDRLPKVSGASTGTPEQIYVTARLNKLFTKAEDEAKKLKDDFISVEHFLLAAVDDSKLFKEFGITHDRLIQALREVRGGQQARSRDRPRRGNPPRHTSPLPPHKKQPGINRRARRRQDRHRGRSRP